MNICNDGHDEVCYEGRNCPCCELRDIIKEHENIIRGLEDEVADLTNALRESESQ